MIEVSSEKAKRNLQYLMKTKRYSAKEYERDVEIAKMYIEILEHWEYVSSTTGESTSKFLLNGVNESIFDSKTKEIIESNFNTFIKGKNETGKKEAIQIFEAKKILLSISRVF